MEHVCSNQKPKPTYNYCNLWTNSFHIEIFLMPLSIVGDLQRERKTCLFVRLKQKESKKNENRQKMCLPYCYEYVSRHSESSNLSHNKLRVKLCKTRTKETKT